MITKNHPLAKFSADAAQIQRLCTVQRALLGGCSATAAHINSTNAAPLYKNEVTSNTYNTALHGAPDQRSFNELI